MCRGSGGTNRISASNAWSIPAIKDSERAKEKERRRGKKGWGGGKGTVCDEDHYVKPSLEGLVLLCRIQSTWKHAAKINARRVEGGERP